MSDSVKNGKEKKLVFDENSDIAEYEKLPVKGDLKVLRYRSIKKSSTLGWWSAVVLLEDLLREAKNRARAIVEEKNPDLTPDVQNEVAQAVALGAIKYPMLARDNTKIATFDWETALDFNGHAAPYIQYAHVRANSILRRAGGFLPESTLPTHTLDKAEIELTDLISRLPAEVERAAADFKTLHLTNLAYDLARAFNNFYNQCPVLKAESEVQQVRLRLVAAARQTIANALQILGINAPEVM